ncbi:hypothetical protein ACFY1B_38190 [Streptomyces mirabilis]|nr:hypothetical protein [Streptomyces sp. AK02-04a]MDX3758587.1 hypothetical protein [Streptomyces sp. AK02-04a]
MSRKWQLGRAGKGARYRGRSRSARVRLVPRHAHDPYLRRLR